MRLAGALAVMALAACSHAPSFNEIDKKVAACQIAAAKAYPRSNDNQELRYYVGDVAETVKTCMRGQGLVHGGGEADKRCFSSAPVGSTINSYCYHPTSL